VICSHTDDKAPRGPRCINQHARSHCRLQTRLRRPTANRPCRLITPTSNRRTSKPLPLICSTALPRCATWTSRMSCCAAVTTAPSVSGTVGRAESQTERGLQPTIFYSKEWSHLGRGVEHAATWRRDQDLQRGAAILRANLCKAKGNPGCSARMCGEGSASAARSAIAHRRTRPNKQKKTRSLRCR
jgi:hypothetical protein